MFDFFGRKKKDREFLLDMMTAAAAGADIAELNRALGTLGIKKEPSENGTKFAGRAAYQFAQSIMDRAGANRGNATEDDLYTGGVFAFIAANHFTFVLKEDFGIAAPLSVMMLLMINGMDEDSASGSIDAIAKTYNSLTAENSNYLQAIGAALVQWTKSPTHELMEKLARLFDISRKHLN